MNKFSIQCYIARTESYLYCLLILRYLDLSLLFVTSFKVYLNYRITPYIFSFNSLHDVAYTFLYSNVCVHHMVV